MFVPEFISKMNLVVGLKYISAHWKFFVIVLVPLIFLPLPLQGTKGAEFRKRKNFAEASPCPRIKLMLARLHDWGQCLGTDPRSDTCYRNLLPSAYEEVTPKELRCAYVVCIMACYWMTEAIPLPVTSLLPVLLFPLLNVESTGKICVVYLKETNMMFIGGLIVAIAVEHCKLHVRIALKVLLMIGTSPKRLLLGFMVTTMFLSMWISNTATTAMMMPIVIAVLDTLKSYEADGNRRPSLTLTAGVTKSRHDTGTFDQETRRKSSIRIDISAINRPTKDQICYFLGIAYAANIGGTGTISGSGTNLVFKGIFESLFPNESAINFASWMAFNVPVMIINCFLAWIWLQILFMGLLNRKNKMKSTPEQVKAVRELIRKRYTDLGPMTYHEMNILILFLVLVCLWFFRKPEFIPGWGTIYEDVIIEDATAAMLIVFLLFVLPANLDFLNIDSSDKRVGKESPALLNWKIVHEKVPWGLILLMGGGFAMAAASQSSGLSNLLGEQLIGLQKLPPVAILVVICLSTTFVTEVSSNTAIANIVLPVLAKLCAAIGLNPLYLMLPTTLCCSYAFMLPVATPPNAIVMAASNMRTLDMIRAGFGMNLICVFSLIICFLTFGSQVYDLSLSAEVAARLGVNQTVFSTN